MTPARGPGVGSASSPPGLYREIVETVRELAAAGLLQGASGNVSVRRPEGGLFITRSGARADRIGVDDIVVVDPDGGHDPAVRPSSEWRMHAAVYAARSDVGAVIHTHSPHATAVSCLRDDLPAFHYMIGMAGGEAVRCAEYATVATPELATAALAALGDRQACLLANHGTLAVGADLNAARDMAEELEHLARVYCIAVAAGEPVVLERREMDDVLAAFRRYR